MTLESLAKVVEEEMAGDEGLLPKSQMRRIALSVARAVLTSDSMSNAIIGGAQEALADFGRSDKLEDGQEVREFCNGLCRIAVEEVTSNVLQILTRLESESKESL
jgi:hypothetical protein